MVFSTQEQAQGATVIREQDTGSLPVVHAECKYLSKNFHEKLDKDYGRAIHENGGYVTYTIRMEGQREPRWWEKLLRFLPGYDKK